MNSPASGRLAANWVDRSVTSYTAARQCEQGTSPATGSAALLAGVALPRSAGAGWFASTNATPPAVAANSPAHAIRFFIIASPSLGTDRKPREYNDSAAAVQGNIMHTFTVRTRRRSEFVEITAEVRAVVQASGLRSGLCVVYCPHTTAAITIQENADPDVVHDLLLWLNEHIPQHVPGFRHTEGNSDSHLKASLVGPSVTIPVADGELPLGRWQGVYLCEFDGARTRSVHVQVWGDS